MDLAYVPHHGSSNYANAEFFKRVRARYYVFSGVEPSREVFNALLEAKKTWENKEQGQDRLAASVTLQMVHCRPAAP
jgi:beta-lactamase superfamily II metal-dependent hydrolase